MKKFIVVFSLLFSFFYSQNYVLAQEVVREDVPSRLSYIEAIGNVKGRDSQEYCDELLMLVFVVQTDQYYAKYFPQLSDLIANNFSTIRKYYPPGTIIFQNATVILHGYLVIGHRLPIDHSYETRAIEALSTIEADLQNPDIDRYEFTSMLASVYELKGDYDKSEKYFKQKLSELKKRYPDDAYKTASTYLDLLKLYDDTHNTKASIQLAKNLKNEKLAGAGASVLALVINWLPGQVDDNIAINLIDLYASEGGNLPYLLLGYEKFATNKKYNVLKKIEASLFKTATDKEMHDFLVNVGLNLKTTDDDNSIPYLVKAIEVGEQAGHHEWNYQRHSDIHHLYSSIGAHYQITNQPEKELEAKENAVKATKADIGKIPVDQDSLKFYYAEALATYSNSISNYRNDKQSELKLLEEAIDVLNTCSQTDRVKKEVYKIRSTMVSAYRECYKYSEAQTLAAQLLTETTDHDELASIHNQIGRIHSDLEQHELAVTEYEIASSLSNNTKDRRAFTKNLASAYRDLYQYDKCIEIYDRLLATINQEESDFGKFMLYEGAAQVYEKVSLERAIEYLDKAETFPIERGFQKHLVTHYQIKAGAYYNAGNQYMRKVCLDKAMSTYDSLHIQDKTLLGVLYRDLAVYYDDVRDYAQAEESFTTAMVYMHDDNITVFHPSYETLLNNYAVHSSKLGNYANAIQMDEYLCQVREMRYGNDNPLYLISLQNLCSEYISNSNIAKVDSVLAVLKPLAEKKNDPDNLSMYYFYLGRSYMLKNQFDLAEQPILKAISISTDDDTKKTFYSYLTDIYAQYNKDKLYPTFVTYTDNQKESIIDNFTWMSSSERKNFLSSISALRDESIEHISIDPRFVGHSLNLALFTKGILIHTENEINRKVAKDKKSRAMLDQIRRKKELLNKATTEGDLNLRKQLIMEIDKFEKDLSASMIDYKFLAAKLNVSYADIQKRLQKTDVAIQFVCSDNNQMSAFIIKKDQDPIYVRLRNDYDKIYSDQLQQVYIDNKMYDAVWAELTPHLNGCRRLYFSADGIFNQIAIEQLENTSHKTISDQYEAHRLFHLAEFGNIMPKISSVYAVGGVDYNTSGTVSVLRSGNSNQWDQLPGTLAEVELIQQNLSKANKQVTVRKGAEATETSFKQLDQTNTDVIHLATHGFYIPDTY